MNGSPSATQARLPPTTPMRERSWTRWFGGVQARSLLDRPPQDGPATILSIMSIAEEWDFTVPEDDAKLLAELPRHGVQPGRRLHVSGRPEREESAGSDDERRPRRLSFAGSIHAEPDLSERTGEYLSLIHI